MEGRRASVDLGSRNFNKPPQPTIIVADEGPRPRRTPARRLSYTHSSLILPLFLKSFQSACWREKANRPTC